MIKCREFAAKEKIGEAAQKGRVKAADAAGAGCSKVFEWPNEALDYNDMWGEPNGEVKVHELKKLLLAIVKRFVPVFFLLTAGADMASVPRNLAQNLRLPLAWLIHGYRG